MAVHSTAKAAVFIWCGHKLVSITVARYNELRASNAQCGLLPYNKSLPCPVTTTGHPDSLLYKYAQGSSQTDCSCRRFLLEWLSFLYRYVPVGLLEVVPQCMQWRPPAFFGRSDLETLLARYLPSASLLVSSSPAFCLSISVFIACLFCLLFNVLCKLRLLLPRLMSHVCQRHTASVHLPLLLVSAQSSIRCAEAEGQILMFEVLALFNPETSILIQRRHATLEM